MEINIAHNITADQARQNVKTFSTNEGLKKKAIIEQTLFNILKSIDDNSLQGCCKLEYSIPIKDSYILDCLEAEIEKRGFIVGVNLNGSNNIFLIKW